MTSPRRSAKATFRGLGWTGAVLAAALAAAPGQVLAGPTDLFLERTLMSAANARCGLFAPDVAAGLAAGAAQARGAVLRAGTDTRAIQALEQRARIEAARIDCRDPRLTGAAARVRDAFSVYARMARITYPGQVADWRADRGEGRAARWRLAQTSRFGADRMTFGLAGREGVSALVAVTTFADGAAPFSARLILRDPGRTNGPYLSLGTGGALSGKLPPRSATKGFLAEARSPASADLLPRDVKTGWAFRFPAAAERELAALDPREAVAVEFLFPGEQVRTAYLEVGDFAAGQAFLKLAAR